MTLLTLNFLQDLFTPCFLRCRVYEIFNVKRFLVVNLLSRGLQGISEVVKVENLIAQCNPNHVFFNSFKKLHYFVTVTKNVLLLHWGVYYNSDFLSCMLAKAVGYLHQVLRRLCPSSTAWLACSNVRLLHLEDCLAWWLELSRLT